MPNRTFFAPGVGACWAVALAVIFVFINFVARKIPLRPLFIITSAFLFVMALKFIGQALYRFGMEAEVMFASHHWPRWGNADVLAYLRLQRDLYRWVHDQTMRYANHGLTPTEIAETLELPPEFRAESHTVGYYGHLAHNAKAVYQRYLSWYDGNPANLWRLPPTDAGARYVELAGGPS